MTFDPREATAHYIDGLGAANLQKAHDYTVGGHWLLLWGLVVSAVIALVIVRSQILDRVERRIPERRKGLRAFVVTAVYVVASALIGLPWSLYAGYFREKIYGRTSQPLADYLGQQALALVLSTILGALFLTGVYWLIRRTGRRWWLWSGALTAGVVAVLMLLSPILIEPLFNKYQPIPAGPVHDAVAEMAGRAGIPENKIFLFDGSRQSNNFTANAGGVGNTARVAISDVAMNKASLDEVRAVTGHEIGHYVLKHTWYGTLLVSVLAMLLFWLADRLYPRFAKAFGSDAPIAAPRSVPILLFMVSLFSLGAMPITSSFSRTIETRADAYSLRTENRPDALSSALVKTAEYRYPRPSEIEELIFYDHPSVERRVMTAMEWKAAHPQPPAP
ncbi:MAG: M48 family metallopeptidase [Sphingomonas sp.]|nr:M48 family metallopeptidase [Sphingomonas sp.]